MRLNYANTHNTGKLISLYAHWITQPSRPVDQVQEKKNEMKK